MAIYCDIDYIAGYTPPTVYAAIVVFMHHVAYFEKSTKR